MFKRATRKKVFLKIGIMGPSGSGKTYSALLLAKGLADGGKIAAIDTENGSLSLYSHLAEVDVLTMQAPFEPKRAIEAINYAASNGYTVIVIDSMTHYWKWLLEYKESMDKQGGNSFTNWAKVKPYFDALKTAMLQSNIHIVCCMRSKDEYVIEKNERGKDAPRKVGMGAINEPGAEYEYTTVFEIGMDHNATASKDRTTLFDGEFAKITAATGKRFLEWLNGGIEVQVDHDAIYEIPPSAMNPDTERIEKRRMILTEWKDLSPSQVADLVTTVKTAGLNATDTIIQAYDQGVNSGEEFAAWWTDYAKPVNAEDEL